MFERLSDHIKETIDHVDGFTTGILIVEQDRNLVSLLIDDVLLPLRDADHIEVRDGDGTYFKISRQQALDTCDGDWPLFAGQYCRVKKGVNEVD